MTEMIDTHCHLTDPRLLTQLDGVLARAAAAGVGRMITIGTSIEDDRAAMALCRGRENLRCAIGVHPNHVAEAEEGDLANLEELQRDPGVVALGETGLDYFHHYAPRDRQRVFFEQHLALAEKTGRPLVIHCREAVDDTLAVMRSFPRVRAVVHCFTGSAAEAERIIGAGYYIGFTGPVTYKKNDELRRAAALVPLERLLVETDAPYLSPEPVRVQKTNEPAFVMHTARMVATIKGITLDELDEAVSRNVADLFGW